MKIHKETTIEDIRKSIIIVSNVIYNLIKVNHSTMLSLKKMNNILHFHTL